MSSIWSWSRIRFPKNGFPNGRITIVDLMLLGTLRYLGRGCTYDDIEEATAISEETHCRFLHAFISIGSTKLFTKFVVTPFNNEDAGTHMVDMSEAGLHGAVGSTNATHIILEKCSQQLHNSHLGGKMKQTARTYNISVNHRRRILSTTTGHPSRWNDKTLILYDTFARGIHDGKIIQDVNFKKTRMEMWFQLIIRVCG
jgi:hypothetical protein